MEHLCASSTTVGVLCPQLVTANVSVAHADMSIRALNPKTDKYE
jgi:hypothetical protein